jgi:hypothetical protein
VSRLPDQSSLIELANKKGLPVVREPRCSRSINRARSSAGIRGRALDTIATVGSHFDAIGFGVPQDRINELLNDALIQGTKIPVSSDTSYYVWTPGGGPELWVGARESGTTRDLLALTPYFRGPSRLRVRIEGVEGDPQYPFEGRIAVWAIPRGQDDQEYPFSIDLADYALLGDLAVGKELNMRIAGFAHSIEWWPDEASYKAATSDLQLAPKSFIPVGMFKDSGAPPSSGLFTGIVKGSQRLMNRATAQEFVHVQVDTLSGEIDVVADVGSVEGVPAIGGVVKATCWLCSTVS